MFIAFFAPIFSKFRVIYYDFPLEPTILPILP